jgi:hypothetical protein
MANGIPRRHHYVTKAYLEGFLEPGKPHLYCYGRKRSEPFQNTPINLANIRDFHSYKRADGSIDCSLEARIEKEIESPGIPILRRLVSGKTNLDYGQRVALARLVALQSIRVPYERNFMDGNNVHNLRSFLNEMDEDAQRLGAPVNAIDIAVTPRDDPKLITKRVRISREQILAEIGHAEKDPGRSSRDALFPLTDGLSKVLVHMEWSVYHASGTERFITSDRPVVRDSADDRGLGRGLKDLRSKMNFPLSSTALLEIRHHNWLINAIRKRRPNQAPLRRKAPNQEITVCEATDSFVEAANLAHAEQAHLWVFSGREQAWIRTWMQKPLKVPKQVVTVSDRMQDLRANHQPAKPTRVRESVIRHE